MFLKAIRDRQFHVLGLSTELDWGSFWDTESGHFIPPRLASRQSIYLSGGAFNTYSFPELWPLYAADMLLFLISFFGIFLHTCEARSPRPSWAEWLHCTEFRQ